MTVASSHTREAHGNEHRAGTGLKLSAYLHRTTFERLKAHALRENVSISSVIRVAVTRHLNSQKDAPCLK